MSCYKSSLAVFVAVMSMAVGSWAQSPRDHVSDEEPVEGTRAVPEAQRLGLDAALARVEEQNETWEVVELRIERSRALQREALASLLPSLRAAASGTYNGIEVQFGDSAVVNQFDWQTSATASITVFDGTKYPLYSRAGELVEASEAEAEWQKATVRFEVEQAFFQLAAAEREVDIAEKTVALREAYVERADALAESGIALPLDAERARAELLDAKQMLVEARSRLGNQADALAVLLGEEPTGSLRADLPEDVNGSPPPAGAYTEGLKQRGDIVSQQRNIVALEETEDSIWWSLAPTLELSANAGFGPESFRAPDGYQWSVTLSLGWLLYDGGARYARARAAAAETQQARLRLQRSRREATGAQQRALRDWKSAHEAIEVAEQQIEVARRAYDMVKARFEAGLATSIEVNEASDVLFRAQIALSQSQLRADVAEARYRYVSGGWTGGGDR